jgi:hypothetical protein
MDESGLLCGTDLAAVSRHSLKVKNRLNTKKNKNHCHCEERSDTSPSSSGLTGGSPDVDTDYRVKPDNDGGLSLDCFARAAKQVLLGYSQRRAVEIEKTTTKARRLEEKTGHCEEQSDVAIHRLRAK